MPRRPPPPTTALGGILTHLGRAPLGKAKYQPSNITWACLPPLEDLPKKIDKRVKYEQMAARALADLARWSGEREARSSFS